MKWMCIDFYRFFSGLCRPDVQVSMTEFIMLVSFWDKSCFCTFHQHGAATYSRGIFLMWGLNVPALSVQQMLFDHFHGSNGFVYSIFSKMSLFMKYVVCSPSVAGLIDKITDLFYTQRMLTKFWSAPSNKNKVSC